MTMQFNARNTLLLAGLGTAIGATFGVCAHALLGRTSEVMGQMFQ